MLRLADEDLGAVQKSVLSLRALAGKLKESKECLELDLIQQCICDHDLYIKQIPLVIAGRL